MPITWRTVLGNMSPAEASRPLQAATQTLDNAFNRLGQMVTDQQGVAQAAVDRGDESKVLAFKEALAAARTPEEVAAIQAQRDQYLGGIQNKFRGELVGAEERRTTGLMDHMTKRLTFDKQQRDERLAPLVQQAEAYAVQGDLTALNNFFISNPEVAQHYQGVLTGKGVAGQRAAEDQTFKRNKDQREGQDQVLKADRQKAELAHWLASEAIQRAQASTQNQRLQLEVRQNLEKNLTDLTGKLANAQGGLGSPGGQAAIEAFLKTIPEGQATRVKMQDALGRLATNPKYASLSPEEAIMAARSSISTGGSFRNRFWNNTGDSIESAADAIMATPEHLARQEGRTRQVATLQQQVLNLKGQLFPGLEEAAAAPPANTPGRSGNAAAPAQAAGPDTRTGTSSPAPTPVADFKPNPKLEEKAREQELQMSLGNRMLYTPDVEKYLRAKDAAAAAAAPKSSVDTAVEIARGRNKIGPLYGTGFDAIARKAQEEAAKKAR